MKIVVLDGYVENPGDLSWEALGALGDLTVYDRTEDEDIVSRIGNAEIVITNKTPITEETMEQCPSIRYIGVLATGYNVVDVEAAKKRGIPVTNIPSYGTETVAQFTMGLLLEICHHIGHHDQAVHEGRWSACEDFCFWDYPMIELAGKTLGLIGYGRIGQAVGRIAQAFGMKLLVYTRTVKKELETEHCRFVSLEELLKEADVISLHCPLQPETEQLIRRETIEQMKDGVILLNSSRGPLIHEADLAEALRSGKVAAAAMDVVSAEPIKEDNPLLTAPNCIITPHIAWAAKEARTRLMNVAVENVRSFLNGTPEHVVNG